MVVIWYSYQLVSLVNQVMDGLNVYANFNAFYLHVHVWWNCALLNCII